MMQASHKGDTVAIYAEIWRELRKMAGHQINPITAEVCWHYGQVVDPYGVHREIPDECGCVGRHYFARNPGGKVWIEFGDLPEATRRALWNKLKQKNVVVIGRRQGKSRKCQGRSDTQKKTSKRSTATLIL